MFQMGEHHSSRYYTNQCVVITDTIICEADRTKPVTTRWTI